VQVNDRLPSEAELSRRFGVSRPIVCEALGRLQTLALTEARAGRGTFVASSVTKLTITFGQYSASDLNEVRRCVEVPAARLAALRTSEDIQLLGSILGAHEQTAGAEEAVATDTGFIARSPRRRGNKLFVRLVEDLREILQEQSLVVSTLRDRGAQVAREHRRILDAIIARGRRGRPLGDERSPRRRGKGHLERPGASGRAGEGVMGPGAHHKQSQG
jgi:DNA-binding FadR family transcriptional regulator